MPASAHHPALPSRDASVHLPHQDPTGVNAIGAWPHGTCCNDGGYCSDPVDNKDRRDEILMATARTTPLTGGGSA